MPDSIIDLAAEVLGERANGTHAWEIAPAHYTQEQDGCPVRCKWGSFDARA